MLGSEGGALLIGGSVFGFLAMGQEGDIAASCNAARECPDDGDVHDKIDAYDINRTLSSIGLISGAVLGAVGITLYLVGQPSSETAEGQEVGRSSRSPALGPVHELTVFSSGSISGLRGRF